MEYTENEVRRALQHFYEIAISTGKDVFIPVGTVRRLRRKDLICMHDGDLVREFADMCGCDMVKTKKAKQITS